ncbi:uncharacterized protein LOC128237217 isoform X2 [Mya arenaria]|uniref:uncharacterized protein LOC128237217 isoform X2 n=1 Tax=Mya arenaria TaxID=6604 RepID=UPI0022E23150|nr:uncharacterized protein LOC128237217 isoform X2 [Mya arenaria]
MKFEDNKMASNLFFENWTSDQVAEWLRGLDMDDAMIPYMHYFMAGNVDGKRLMMMTHSDLEKLNVLKFGHQELILEAIDLLRNLRYGYETENLQTLALQLGCKARSLKSEVRARASENDRNRANMIQPVEPPGGRRLTIGILSSVADLVCTLKSLVAWMDKAPFSGFHDLCLTRNSIVKHGLDLINMCQRESSIPDIEFNISNTMASLSEICEKLVIGSTDSPLDPLYLQPASLELATIRKKPGEELGMHILSSYYGVHVISGIKDMSPADLCGKIEKGDEVIQVNQQIVAGWSLKKLVNLLKENPKEVTLLLKKRPRHIVPYGQMPHKKKREVQASTLPKSRKKLRSRDGDSTKLRPTLPEFVNTVPSPEEQEDLDSPKETNDGNDTDNDVFRSGSESPQFQQFTLPVHADPKQRRATVSGGSPTLSRPLLIIEDIDTPTRPKSFTIASTTGNMTHEIIINSPSGENLSELGKIASAMEKRQEFKTKSTPPSLEFSVRKPTPKIVEPTPKIVEPRNIPEIQVRLTKDAKDESFTHVNEDKNGGLKSDEGCVIESLVHKLEETKITDDNELVSRKLNEMADVESKSHETINKEKDTQENGKESEKETDKDITNLERSNQSPERLLDSSTDSVPPSESSMESSQTYTSSLESSSHSPPLEESIHSEKDAGAGHREKHVGFEGVDSDKEGDSNQSYVCKVAGGVVQKIPVENHEVKRRPKSGRKRVNRRISCKDLGQGDCQGWLYKRRSKGGFLHSPWQHRWCIIKDYNLFCYHDKESIKAEVVIHLPAFQVSPLSSSELKTTKFAFKIHNSGTSFCFASDRREDMSKWMNKMGLAAIAYTKKPDPAKYGNPDYSESDTDDTGSREPSPQNSPSQTRAAFTQKKSSLSMPQPEVRASQEDLSVMIRKQSQRAQNLFGEDKNKQRRRTMSRDYEKLVTPEVIAYKKRQALERTLKARERELEQLEQMLSCTSRENLHTLKRTMKKRLETDSD